MKTVAAAIQIDALPEAAGAVGTSPGRCQQWNPLIPEASGQVAAGKVPARAEAGFGMPHGAISGRARRR
jgi:hypothetical protein